MKKFTLMTCLLLPLGLLAQNFPKGVTKLTGNDVTVTSEDDRAGIKKNPFVVANGKLFFTAKNDANGDELWVSDGTAAGTKMVKDINSGTASSSPRFLVELEGKVYFQASDATNGTELWVSDGTDAGTKLIKDVYTGSSSSSPEMLTPLKGNLIFSASTAESEVDQQKWLYIYKPADGSVSLIKSGVQARNTGDCNYRYIVPNETKGVAYFVGQEKGVNDEIWVTDGTSAGTKKIKEITAEALGQSDIQWLYNFKDSAIFWRQKTPRGYANAYGGDSTKYTSNLSQQVWVSDGTEAGTHMLKFIDQKVDGTSGEGTNTQAAWPYTYKGKLYFRADDGSHGVELWVSDLSTDTSKTKLYRDINPGEWPSWAEDFANYKGMMCFDADAGGSSWGAEPSYSDGTFGQLNNIADLQPGNAGAWASRLKVLQINGKDSLLFGVAGQPGIGSELWYVRDFVNGASSIDMGGGDSKPFNLTPMNSAMYYTTTTLPSLFKFEFTPTANVKFKTQINFDLLNYKVPQPLVIYKDNLASFVDPELEFSTNAGKAILLSTDKVNYYENAILSDKQVDTIWIKVNALNPDSSLRVFKISTTFMDKNDNVEVKAETDINCLLDPAFRADLLYLVKAGIKDPSKLAANEKFGKNQSNVDQAFGADATTGKNWGYENSGWSTGNDVTDKWGNEREMDKTAGKVTYKFEVENGTYLIHLGFSEFWGGRTENILINDEDPQEVVLTASNNRIFKTAKVVVTDGMIVIEAVKVQDNALFSWIKIGKVVEGTSCFTDECTARDKEYQDLINTVPQVDLKSSYSIYPNPTNGEVNLKVTENVFNSFSIYGIDGKLVYSNKIKEGQSQLNMNVAKSGLYIIKLNGEKASVADKLIVK